VGLHAINLAKLAGLKIVSTASPHNHALLKSLGADAVFDYKDPEVVQKIKEWTLPHGGVTIALDCVAEHGESHRVLSEGLTDMAASNLHFFLL
jgi:NADPH:quinone reductase-like Zn-dependent oxidoreductase